MNNNFPPLPVRIVVVLIILGTLAYFGIRSFNTPSTGNLDASGTIESVTVNLSPEMAGKVKDVLVAEGQAVKAGDPLLSLDDSLLAAQHAVASAQVDSANAALNTAQAAYATAQQQYDMSLTNALAAEKATRLSVWKDTKPTEFNLPVWYFSKEERVQAAQAQVDSTSAALKDEMQKLDDIQSRAGSAQFLQLLHTVTQLVAGDVQ